MEKELTKVITNEEGKNIPVIDSREVAEMLGKEHKYVLRDIEGTDKVIGILPTLIGANLHSSNYFIKSTYKDGNNRTQKCYLCTKMGCELLGNKQQGEKGILFTAKYVERFNQYEEQLKQTRQPQLPQTYLEALKSLVASEEERLRLEEEKKELENDNKHKTNVIEGLTEDISLADKRQRITQMIRYGSSNYAERYNLLYKEFNLAYHIDVKRRLENAKERGEVKKSVKSMDYICSEKYLNMTNELFILCCKVFETEWKNILKDMENIIKRD